MENALASRNWRHCHAVLPRAPYVVCVKLNMYRLDQLSLLQRSSSVLFVCIYPEFRFIRIYSRVSGNY